MEEDEIRNRTRETKAGSKPTVNASIDPERGYAISEEKAKLKELMKK